MGFQVNQNLTADQTAVQAGVDQWVADDDGDTPQDGLNATITNGTGVTQQALALDTLLTDVVLGEAKANYEGNPC